MSEAGAEAAPSVWGRQWALCVGAQGGVWGWHGGTPAGMCWPVWEFKRMAPLVVRSPAGGSLTGLAHLSHGVEGLEWPREVLMGRKFLAPPPPPPASLSILSGPGKGWGWGIGPAHDAEVLVTLSECLPPSRPVPPSVASDHPVGTSSGPRHLPHSLLLSSWRGVLVAATC